MSNFPERLRELKEKNNLTLKEMSERLNISVSNLSYYMKDREPSYDTLIQIAKHFDVSTDWLLGLSDAPSITQDYLLRKIKESDFSEYTEKYDPYNSISGFVDDEPDDLGDEFESLSDEELDLMDEAFDKLMYLLDSDQKTYLDIQEQLFDCLRIIYGLLLLFTNQKNTEVKEKAYTTLSLLVKNIHSFFSFYELALTACNNTDFLSKDQLLKALQYGELTASLEENLFNKFSYQFIQYLISISEELDESDKKITDDIISYLLSKNDLEISTDQLKALDKQLTNQRKKLQQIIYGTDNI